MAALEDDFCDIVRKARTGQGRSVEALAQSTGLTVSTIEDLERGRQPEKRESDALAAALDLDAWALWQIANGAYRPDVDETMEDFAVVSFTFEGMNSRGYLVHHRAAGQTWMIDPGGAPAAIERALGENGWSLTAILLTHGHADHVAGLDALRARVPAPVYAHPGEWNGPELRPVQGDAEFAVGGVSIAAVACPGHTPGGLAFSLGAAVFVGDALFAGSLGRAQGGPRSYSDLLASARRLVEFPAETKLFPGHGPTTSAALERRHNPFLAAWARELADR